VTPVRVVVAVALAGSLGAILYGARIARDDTQLPILVAGMVALGLTCLFLAGAGMVMLLRAGRAGDTRGAFFAALLGGVSALFAAGALAGAVILALVLTNSG
jgi:hypothetical protein